VQPSSRASDSDYGHRHQLFPSSPEVSNPYLWPCFCAFREWMAAADQLDKRENTQPNRRVFRPRSRLGAEPKQFRWLARWKLVERSPIYWQSRSIIDTDAIREPSGSLTGQACRRTSRSRPSGGQHPSLMQIGILGLGRMGAHTARRLLRGGHDCVAFDMSAMAAYAEGLAILRQANAGKKQTAVAAETRPLRHLELYQYELNLTDIAEVWRRAMNDSARAVRRTMRTSCSRRCVTSSAATWKRPRKEELP
jgi:hypothetical protein